MGSTHDWMVRARAVRERRGVERSARTHPSGLIDFASNDYLDLSRDDRIVEAAIAATRRHGAGSRASRVVTGTLPPHEDLEAALGELTGQASALVCSTGYAANLAAITALSSPGAIIVHDEHVHASIVDAARLSRAAVSVVPHGDLEALRAVLATRVQTRAIVVVESLYSVLGDAADLRATAAVCAQHDAVLVVDEAHGIGVLGDGRGGVHAAGLAHRDDVVVTLTLSKALGAMGGAVLGAPQIRAQVINAARPFIFDTGLAPGPAAAAAAAARVIMSEPDRVARLHLVATRIADTVRVPALPGPIQSIVIGDPDEARSAAARFRRSGVLVGCFRPPSVPDGVSRLRLTAHSGASDEDLDRLGVLVRGLAHSASGPAR